MTSAKTGVDLKYIYSHIREGDSVLKNALRIIGFATLGICAGYCLCAIVPKAVSGLARFRDYLSELAALSDEDEKEDYYSM